MTLNLTITSLKHILTELHDAHPVPRRGNIWGNCHRKMSQGRECMDTEIDRCFDCLSL